MNNMLSVLMENRKKKQLLISDPKKHGAWAKINFSPILNSTDFLLKIFI